MCVEGSVVLWRTSAQCFRGRTNFENSPPQSKSPENLQFSEDLGAFVRSWGTPRDGGITGVR